MKIISGTYWEKGKGHGPNEDSIALQQYLSAYGRILIAVVCDGVGGMEEGENASGYVTEAMILWFHEEFIRLLRKKSGRARIRRSLYRQFYKMNEVLNDYGEQRGIVTGTTASIFVLYQDYYVYAHSGDSRIYSISGKKSKQLTRDHSYKNTMLYRAVGGGSFEQPDIGFGRVRSGTAYLLCTDGFWHRLKGKELPLIFNKSITGEGQIVRRLRELGDRAMRRGEKDNMSAICVLCR